MHIAVEAMILIINTRVRDSLLVFLFLSLSLSRLFCFRISRVFSHSVPSAASRRIASETAIPLMARVQRQEYRFNELCTVVISYHIPLGFDAADPPKEGRPFGFARVRENTVHYRYELCSASFASVIEYGYGTP